MTPDLEVLRGRLVGRELPEGRWSVPADEAARYEDCFRSPSLPEGLLHPVSVFLSSLVGVGYGIAELWELAEVRAEDGPMLGETSLRQVRPLRRGEALTVRSRITDVVRKTGRSGTFDLVMVEVDLLDDEGQDAGGVHNTYVYPRPERS